MMEEQGLTGRFNNLKKTEDGFQFNIGRMGTFHTIHYIDALRKVEIETYTRPFISVLLGMHMTFGFDHESWAYNLFAAFNLFVSIALLLLGGTGIYLWFKIHKERWVGSIILISSLVTLGGSATVDRSRKTS